MRLRQLPADITMWRFIRSAKEEVDPTKTRLRLTGKWLTQKETDEPSIKFMSVTPETKTWQRGGILTCVGAGQVVSRIGFFDDVLMDLEPLALSVTPETEKNDGETEN